MSKTALVTGSAGFVGRRLHRALDERGYDATCVDIKGGTDALDVFASDASYDLVMHCAAHVGGRADIDGKPLYLASKNLQLDAALFDWALRTRPGRVCYFSSSAAYPTFLQEHDPPWGNLTQLAEMDIDHQDPASPDQSYGLVKLVGEQLAEMAETAGIRTHVFRPFSGYGPEQDLTYPWPSLIERARLRHDPFLIWGDGTQVRDWIHIEDVVGGILACIDADVVGPTNLCTGRGVEFNELAKMMCREVGYEPELSHRLDAPRGVTYRVGDPTKLNMFYESKWTVEDGIKESLGGF